MTTAREYARSSKGKGGRSKSTVDQHAENLRAGQEYGPWTWGVPYEDTGSASRYATKNRDSFDRLTADLASGAFGEPGTVLVLWEISRLSREMGVGTKIVDLCEAGRYRIHITSDERTYNPANYNDRHALQAGINDAEREAGRLSKRTLRGVNSNLDAVDENGDPAARPHGICPFGFQREYAFLDGRPRPVRQFEQEEEAEIIRELFRRVLDGDSIMSVSRDFTTRGITSRKGTPFSPQTLRVMLTHEAYRGYRVHKDKAIKASWSALVDAPTWHGVQNLLADPSRRSHTGEGIKHVLSMILRCAVCGGPMTVTYRRSQKSPLPPAYQCQQNACTRITKDLVDHVVIGDLDAMDPESGEPAPTLGVLLAYLAAPHRHATLSRRPESGSEEASMQAELTRLRGELKELEDAPSPKTARARIQRTADMEEYETDIAALEEKLSALTTPDPLARLLPANVGEDVVGWWKTADVQHQRAVAAILLTPELLGQVRIKRVADSSDAVTDRLEWVRTDADNTV